MITDFRASHLSIAQYVERLGRTVQADGFVHGLNPAQWAALRYFAQANRFSRTVGAFAQYQGSTSGTATQTAKTLVEKGYLIRHSAKRDRRSYRLELSAKARRLLAKDPLFELVTAAEALSPEHRLQVLAGLGSILERVRIRRDQPLFGVCGCSCRYLHENDASGNQCYKCELYGEPLDLEELANLCVNYTPPSEPSVPDRL